MPKNKYKISYGVALCRFNPKKNSRTEILMVKKRYTYHYFNFIFGYYKKYNNKYLQYLFNNMTFGEKIDILSMKYNHMWYRLWLCDPDNNYDIGALYNKNDAYYKNLKYYFRKKSKFESIFLRDGGKKLRKLINNSTSAVTPWEIPKGGIKPNEKEYTAAIREFEEETCITPEHYSILWNIKPIIVSHKDDDIIYKSIYYIACFKNNSKWIPKIKFDTLNQLSEIEQVRWISMDEIKFLNLNQTMEKRLIHIYKTIVSKFKKNVKSTHYTQI